MNRENELLGIHSNNDNQIIMNNNNDAPIEGLSTSPEDFDDFDDLMIDTNLFLFDGENEIIVANDSNNIGTTQSFLLDSIPALSDNCNNYESLFQSHTTTGVTDYPNSNNNATHAQNAQASTVETSAIQVQNLTTRPQLYQNNVQAIDNNSNNTDNNQPYNPYNFGTNAGQPSQLPEGMGFVPALAKDQATGKSMIINIPYVVNRDNVYNQSNSSNFNLSIANNELNKQSNTFNNNITPDIAALFNASNIGSLNNSNQPKQLSFVDANGEASLPIIATNLSYSNKPQTSPQSILSTSSSKSKNSESPPNNFNLTNQFLADDAGQANSNPRGNLPYGFATSDNKFSLTTDYLNSLDGISNCSDPNDSKHHQTTSNRKDKRLAHNAIEKKYRISINSKINELKDIVTDYQPSPLSSFGGNQSNKLQHGDEEIKRSPLDHSPNFLGSGAKCNKSAILQKTIDMIRALQRENTYMKKELRNLRQSVGTRSNGMSFSHTFQDFPQVGALNMPAKFEKSSALPLNSLFNNNGTVKGSENGNGVRYENFSLNPNFVINDNNQVINLADYLAPIKLPQQILAQTAPPKENPSLVTQLQTAAFLQQAALLANNGTMQGTQLLQSPLNIPINAINYPEHVLSLKNILPNGLNDSRDLINSGIVAGNAINLDASMLRLVPNSTLLGAPPNGSGLARSKDNQALQQTALSSNYVNSDSKIGDDPGFAKHHSLLSSKILDVIKMKQRKSSKNIDNTCGSLAATITAQEFLNHQKKSSAIVFPDTTTTEGKNMSIGHQVPLTLPARNNTSSEESDGANIIAEHNYVYQQKGQNPVHQIEHMPANSYMSHTRPVKAKQMQDEMEPKGGEGTGVLQNLKRVCLGLSDSSRFVLCCASMLLFLCMPTSPPANASLNSAESHLIAPDSHLFTDEAALNGHFDPLGRKIQSAYSYATGGYYEPIVNLNRHVRSNLYLPLYMNFIVTLGLLALVIWSSIDFPFAKNSQKRLMNLKLMYQAYLSRQKDWKAKLKRSKGNLQHAGSEDSQILSTFLRITNRDLQQLSFNYALPCNNIFALMCACLWQMLITFCHIVRRGLISGIKVSVALKLPSFHGTRGLPGRVKRTSSISTPSTAAPIVCTSCFKNDSGISTSDDEENSGGDMLHCRWCGATNINEGEIGGLSGKMHDNSTTVVPFTDTFKLDGSISDTLLLRIVIVQRLTDFVFGHSLNKTSEPSSIKLGAFRLKLWQTYCTLMLYNLLRRLLTTERGALALQNDVSSHQLYNRADSPTNYNVHEIRDRGSATLALAVVKAYLTLGLAYKSTYPATWIWCGTKKRRKFLMWCLNRAYDHYKDLPCPRLKSSYAWLDSLIARHIYINAFPVSFSQPVPSKFRFSQIPSLKTILGRLINKLIPTFVLRIFTRCQSDTSELNHASAANCGTVSVASGVSDHFVEPIESNPYKRYDMLARFAKEIKLEILRSTFEIHLSPPINEALLTIPIVPNMTTDPHLDRQSDFHAHPDSILKPQVTPTFAKRDGIIVDILKQSACLDVEINLPYLLRHLLLVREDPNNNIISCPNNNISQLDQNPLLILPPNLNGTDPKQEPFGAQEKALLDLIGRDRYCRWWVLALIFSHLLEFDCDILTLTHLHETVLSHFESTSKGYLSQALLYALLAKFYSKVKSVIGSDEMPPELLDQFTGERMNLKINELCQKSLYLLTHLYNGSEKTSATNFTTNPKNKNFQDVQTILPKYVGILIYDTCMTVMEEGALECQPFACESLKRNISNVAIIGTVQTLQSAMPLYEKLTGSSHNLINMKVLYHKITIELLKVLIYNHVYKLPATGICPQNMLQLINAYLQVNNVFCSKNSSLSVLKESNVDDDSKVIIDQSINPKSIHLNSTLPTNSLNLADNNIISPTSIENITTLTINPKRYFRTKSKARLVLRLFGSNKARELDGKEGNSQVDSINQIPDLYANRCTTVERADLLERAVNTLKRYEE